MPESVYVFRADDGSYKIGRSKDAAERLKRFTTLPIGVEIEHVIEADDAPWLERAFHRLFAAKRVRGEWFRLDEADVEFIRSHTMELPTGEKVRVRYCLEVTDNSDPEGPTQRTFWGHVDTATPEFLKESLRQRRNRVACDVRQLRADLKFINKVLADRGQLRIQLSFDFTGESRREEPAG